MEPRGDCAKERGGESRPQMQRDSRLPRKRPDLHEARPAKHFLEDRRREVVQVKRWVVESSAETERSKETEYRSRVWDAGKKNSPGDEDLEDFPQGTLRVPEVLKHVEHRDRIVRAMVG